MKYIQGIMLGRLEEVPLIHLTARGWYFYFCFSVFSVVERVENYAFRAVVSMRSHFCDLKALKGYIILCPADHHPHQAHLSCPVRYHWLFRGRYRAAGGRYINVDIQHGPTSGVGHGKRAAQDSGNDRPARRQPGDTAHAHAKLRGQQATRSLETRSNPPEFLKGPKKRGCSRPR